MTSDMTPITQLAGWTQHNLTNTPIQEGAVKHAADGLRSHLCLLALGLLPAWFALLILLLSTLQEVRIVEVDPVAPRGGHRPFYLHQWLMLDVPYLLCSSLVQ